MELSETEIKSLYTWIDKAKFTRTKRNITRDFSDGVSIAELIHFHIPKIIELHNYSPANSVAQKMYNWSTLETKVLKRLGMKIDDEVIDAIVNLKPGYVEYLLYDLWHKVSSINKIEEYQNNSARHPASNNKYEYALPKSDLPELPELRQDNGEYYVELQQRNQEMEETIQVLQIKVSRLEQLLCLKDQKINELSLAKQRY